MLLFLGAPIAAPGQAPASDGPALPMEEALAHTPASREVRWPPDDRFACSNPGYGIADYILEQTAGRSFEEVRREQMLTPLGMWRSSFVLDGPLAMPDQETYHEREVGWKQWASLGALFVALALLLSTLFYALWWVPRQLYRKLKQGRAVSPYLYVRALPLAATIAFFSTIILFVAATQDVTALGEMTAASIGFTVSSLLFAVLSIASLIAALDSFRRPLPLPLRVHALLVSLALFGLTVFFTYWRIIGLHLW